MNKYIPQILVERVLDQAVHAVKATLPLVAGRQRLNEEINQTLIKEFSVVREVVDELIENATRRLNANQTSVEKTADSITPEDIKKIGEIFDVDIFKDATPPPEVEFTTLDLGRAFKGTKTVRVPVTMRPMMHMSQRGSWSWRTMVDGHDGYRHINVTNFHSSEVDNFGNLYAVVDAEWVTDQPVFAEYCNQSRAANEIPF